MTLNFNMEKDTNKRVLIVPVIESIKMSGSDAFAHCIKIMKKRTKVHSI